MNNYFWHPLLCLPFEGFQERSFLPLVANVGNPDEGAHGGSTVGTVRLMLGY